MAFFDSFTISIKQKWLQFFQMNRDWITMHMEVESVYTPDGGRRPPSYLILGVVNALEPKLAQLMMPFSKLNPDADTLVEVLDLNFDPDLALGNRHIQKVQQEEQIDEFPVAFEEADHDETLTISHTNGYGEGKSTHNLVMVDAHEQSHLVTDTLDPDELRAIQKEFGDIALSREQNLKDEFHNQLNTDVDEFGDISFDELKEVNTEMSAAPAPEGKLDYEMLEDLSTPNENAFGDVLPDVWSEETSANKGEANNHHILNKEMSPDAFDDTEISRLFPNT